MLSRARRRDPRGRRDHPGRGMVRRQLPHRGGRPSRGPGGSSSGILPPVAKARGGTPGGLPAGARAGLALRRPQRQPLRARDPPTVRPAIPARSGADHRRAVGRPDRPASGAPGEPPAPGRADRQRPRCPPGRGRARERIAGAWRGTGAPSGLSATRGRCPADGLHRAARPAPAGAGSRVDPGARMAQRTAVRPGHVTRGARASGASAPGGHERDGPQRDYQHADDVDVRLGGVLRKRQSGRCRAARGERLRRDGLQDARPIPSRDRGPRSRFPADGHRRRPGGDRSSEPRRVGAGAGGHSG